MSVPTMEIFVKDTEGHTIRLNVHTNDTVDDVKELVLKEWPQLSKRNIRIIFRGGELDSDMTLTEAKVEKECTLHLVHARDSKMRIVVEYSSVTSIPASIEFMVKQTTTTDKIIDKTCEHFGLDPNLFLFMFEEVRVKKGQTVAELQLEDGDKISVKRRQTGGN